MFSKIRGREDALHVISDASAVYFTLGIFQFVVAFTGRFNSFSLLILLDALVNLVLGGVLRKVNSRVAAVALLVNLLGAAIIGDGPLFHILLLWPSIRAVEAAFRMHPRVPERERENNVTAPPAPEPEHGT
ncbi:MAG: hypothetical protein LAO56_17120 [Acidobacteriia bacterium]|nr:hypothetical protein [Terriglobia bacterium]